MGSQQCKQLPLLLLTTCVLCSASSYRYYCLLHAGLLVQASAACFYCSAGECSYRHRHKRTTDTETEKNTNTDTNTDTDTDTDSHTHTHTHTSMTDFTQHAACMFAYANMHVAMCLRKHACIAIACEHMLAIHARNHKYGMADWLGKGIGLVQIPHFWNPCHNIKWKMAKTTNTFSIF